jgi:hypothetical protein
MEAVALVVPKLQELTLSEAVFRALFMADGRGKYFSLLVSIAKTFPDAYKETKVALKHFSM